MRATAVPLVLDRSMNFDARSLGVKRRSRSPMRESYHIALLTTPPDGSPGANSIAGRDSRDRGGPSADRLGADCGVRTTGYTLRCAQLADWHSRALRCQTRCDRQRGFGM